MNADHRFGERTPPNIKLSDLAGEVFIRRADCEIKNDRTGALDRFTPSTEHQVETEHDLLDLLDANAGVAFLSMTAPQSAKVRRLQLVDIQICRTISVYAVIGRMNSTAVGLFLSLLRAVDWSPLGVSEPA